MEGATKKILGTVNIAAEIVDDISQNGKNIADLAKKIEEYAARDITLLLDAVLLGGINLNASDIHIEPQKEQVRIRVRIDGALRDVSSLEQSMYKGVLSRIKLLSKVKLNIADKPQDGRFTVAAGGALIEVRTSVLPAEYGESVVMRLLNPKNLMELEALGLRRDLYEIFQREIKRPNGMIIVTGPTGAGKTTTLYAFLMKIQSPEIKIITVEDPIEYHLSGVSQTQVAPEKGYSFAEGLKSIVRQDPDVILIGEIRDLETAKIALQASLTGHLVLSTLHTNDAAGAVPRFIDLGAQPSSVAPALKMVVGERLVRKVCRKCAIFEKPSPQELSEIKKGLNGLSKEILNNLPALKDLNKIKTAKAKEEGCKECNFTGYSGRKGIFETFLVDDEMERFIVTSPPVSAIKDLLIKKGMATMYQSGLIEVALGETTIEEVKKVAEADE